ncbi:MAG: tRNA pseudouridine(55) synthase TruB [bacterium]|nr:tRNA pseudouridine(55) synthase TruB [bacterium]
MVPNRTYLNGTLLLDKEPGMTSHEAVSQIRRTVSQRRIGHTGTLDPLAEGLLVVCLGKATKVVQFLTSMEKTYKAEITLGRTSPTYDAEGVDFNQAPFSAPDMSVSEIDSMLDKFRGEIVQQVPAYSAVRVDGRRLYEAARSNEPVDPPKRMVQVMDLKVIEYDNPRITLEVTCSKGTYIRSLAHDIGDELQCGGFLSHLRRTRVGKFSVEDALTVTQVEELHEQGELNKHLLPYNKVLNYPAVTISDEFRKYVISGRDLTKEDIVKVHNPFEHGETMMLRDPNGRVIAVGTAEVDSDALNGEIEKGRKLFTYLRVLN